MTPQELVSALGIAGIPARIARQEVAVQVCVFCTNSKWNLELNAEKGVFHSWCCKRGGRLDQLLKDLTGQDYRIAVQRVQKDPTAPPPKAATEFTSQPVSDIPSAAMYLQKRGIAADVVLRYGIVFVNHPGHRLHCRIALPARDYWTGNVEGWTGRSYTGQQPKYITTLQKKIITGWKQRSYSAPAVIVEGPLDGVAVHRAGFHAAVLSGVGAAGIEEWASRLDPEVPVVIMLDGEPEAQEQARRLYWKVAAVRPVPVIAVPPEGADPASMGAVAVASLVTEALSRSAATSST